MRGEDRRAHERVHILGIRRALLQPATAHDEAGVAQAPLRLLRPREHPRRPPDELRRDVAGDGLDDRADASMLPSPHTGSPARRPAAAPARAARTSDRGRAPSATSPSRRSRRPARPRRARARSDTTRARGRRAAVVRAHHLRRSIHRQHAALRDERQQRLRDAPRAAADVEHRRVRCDALQPRENLRRPRLLRLAQRSYVCASHGVPATITKG